MWRIFGFDMQKCSPNVILLHVHLQGEQVVVHDEDASHEQRRSAAKNAVTDLIRYIRRPRGHPFDSLTWTILSSSPYNQSNDEKGSTETSNAGSRMTTTATASTPTTPIPLPPTIKMDTKTLCIVDSRLACAE